MHGSEQDKISHVLGKRSFRNGLGYATFFLLVMLPTADAWQADSETVGFSTGHSNYATGNLPIRDGRLEVRKQLNQSCSRAATVGQTGASNGQCLGVNQVVKHHVGRNEMYRKTT